MLHQNMKDYSEQGRGGIISAMREETLARKLASYQKLKKRQTLRENQDLAAKGR
jgi:hypothetical protein